MTRKSVDLTHPKIPGSFYSAFAHQVDMWLKQGWEIVTGDKPENAPEKPAAKKPAKPDTTAPAVAPTDTPKES